LARLSKEERKVSIMQKALQLFSKEGFYATTIPDIAKNVGMSVGNMYNYFTSKEILAKEIIIYISEILGDELRQINEMPVSAKEKIQKITHMYFTLAEERPETIEYFLRVYLSNREVFSKECSGMVCVSSFVTELMLFFDEGVQSGELKDQKFFAAFGLFMGYLGGMVFLFGEELLDEPLESYEASISENFYNALRSSKDDKA